MRKSNIDWMIMRIFLIIVCCLARVKGAGFDADEVTRVIEETFKCYNNPGLAVSVVKDGKVSTRWSFTDAPSCLVKRYVCYAEYDTGGELRSGWAS